MIPLTIIIPVYNCQKYIGRCLHSLLAQTNSEFELIVIDDGSSDNSYDVATNLLRERKHTSVFRQENHGVSYTRNFGIEKASGVYIAFVDADDTVSDDYVATLLNIVQAGKYDFVMSGTEYQENGVCKRQIKLDNEEWDRSVLQEGRFDLIDYTTSIHGKLYKKSLLQKYHLRFDVNMSLAEDRDFNIQYLMCIGKAKNTPYIGYYYSMDVAGSLSKKHYVYQMQNDIAYWNKLYVLLDVDKLDDDSLIHQQLSNRLFHFIVDNLAEIAHSNSFLKGKRLVKESIDFTNTTYLLKHQHLIKASRWQKMCIPHFQMLYTLFCLRKSLLFF